MIIKEPDDRKQQIDILQSLIARPDCPAESRKRIEQEVRNIQSGIRGEEEAAYEMKVRYGQSKNWMVVHDLRVEHNGLVAQIDHLILNRFMEIWVCESKRFSEGVAINEHGEFAAFYGAKPYGVPSPIEQNSRHILILKRLLESGTVKLPKRLGFTINPDLRGLVLVSKNARISRPKAKIAGLECVIKNDQLFKTIDKAIDDNNNPLLVAKIIGSDTLEQLARDIARLHRPAQFNWAGKFGLPETPPAATQTKKAPVASEKTTTPPPQPPAEVAATVPAQAAAVPEKKRLICTACTAPITYTVAKFCWTNKKRFGGNAYCMDCQKLVQAA